MKRLMKCIVFVILTSVVFCLLIASVAPSVVNATSFAKDAIEVRILVEVFDIDLIQKSAQVKIHLLSFSFPYNVTEIVLVVGGGGLVEIPCGAYDGILVGDSNTTTWYLDGRGELFPFDRYAMNFMLGWEVEGGFVFPNPNFTLASDSRGELTSSRAAILGDVWQITEEFSMRNFNSVSPGAQRLDVVLVRKSITPFFQFVLPIIACYWLLGASILIKRKKLGDRFQLFLSLFLFAPTFLFAIQPFLPHRGSLSIPEFLLTNLVISNAVFAITNIIPVETLTPRKSHNAASFLDNVASLLSSFIFLALMLLFLPLLSYPLLFIVLAVAILGGYFSGHLIPFLLAHRNKVLRPIRRVMRRDGI